MKSVTESNKATCPAWCRAPHRHGVAFHSRYIGMVGLKRGKVHVTVTQMDRRDCVEISFTVARGEKASAFLSQADMRSLRDHLDEAIGAFDAA